MFERSQKTNEIYIWKPCSNGNESSECVPNDLWPTTTPSAKHNGCWVPRRQQVISMNQYDVRDQRWKIHTRCDFSTRLLVTYSTKRRKINFADENSFRSFNFIFCSSRWMCVTIFPLCLDTHTHTHTVHAFAASIQLDARGKYQRFFFLSFFALMHERHRIMRHKRQERNLMVSKEVTTWTLI